MRIIAFWFVSESESSQTIEELFSRILSINNDIYTQVPEIEQERLFMVSSTLYYLVGEIENLKRDGQMFVATFNSVPLLKTRSEYNGGSFWGECTQFFSSVAYTIGMVIQSHGGQMVVKSAVRAAGAAGWLITACFLFTSDQTGTRCMDTLQACLTNPFANGKHLDCRNCYNECMNDGGWPYYKCPI